MRVAEATRRQAIGVAVWVAYTVVLFLIGKDVTTSGKMLTIVGVFAVLMVVAALRPKAAIVIAIVSVFSLDWIASIVPGVPDRVAWLQEVMLLAMGATAAMQARRRTRGSLGVGVPIAMLLILGIISIVVNAESPIVGLLGYRNYWKHILLFAALLVIDLDEEYRRRLVWLIVGLAAFQAPVALIQKFSSSAQTGDIVGGTLGVFTSGTLTILLLGVAGLVMGWYMSGVEGSNRYPILMGVLLVPVALNETKVFFFVAPLLFAWLLRKRTQTAASRSIMMIIVLIALFFGVYQAFDALYGSGAGRSVFSRSFLESYLLSEKAEGGVMNRLPAAVFALEEISKDPVTLLMGNGPGTASDSTFEFGVGSVFKKYGDLKVDSSFFSRFTLEYGLLGIVAFGILIFSLMRMNTAMRRTCTDPFWLGVSVGFEAIVLLLTGLTVYTSTFTIDSLSLAFWLLAGLVGRYLLEARAREREVAPSVALGDTLSAELLDETPNG